MNRVEGNVTKDQFELEAEPTRDAASAAPILITEKELVFSTAAAVAVRPTRRWWPTTTGRRPRRHYPRRYGFLERSCMAREMDRL
jgi:hypothetical protein